MSHLEITIRPAEITDARDVNLLRRMPGVMENLLSLPSESLLNNEKFISGITENDHLFVAEMSTEKSKRVVGVVGLHRLKSARKHHCAEIGIMVHKDFHGQGIGKKLMAAVVDLADNWLLLMRLQLTVYPDNDAAIKLYEKFGFVREGLERFASVRHGKYDDVVSMARYHQNLIK